MPEKIMINREALESMKQELSQLREENFNLKAELTETATICSKMETIVREINMRLDGLET